MKDKELLEPIFQIWTSTDSCNEFFSWDDVDEEEYIDARHDDRRKLCDFKQAEYQIAALKQVVSALESQDIYAQTKRGEQDKAIAALKAALEEKKKHLLWAVDDARALAEELDETRGYRDAAVTELNQCKIQDIKKLRAELAEAKAEVARVRVLLDSRACRCQEWAWCDEQ